MIKQTLKSICILRLSAIGDVCHAVAIVQAIQRQYPKAKVVWIMGTVEAQLLADLPGIDVVVFDKSLGWRGMKEVWHALKGHRFDVLLHMQVALRASVLSLGIKAKQRVGFSWQRAKEGQWLFTNRKLPSSNSLHVLDNFADFSRYLGVKFERPQWFIPLSDSDIQFATKQVTPPALVICPSASKEERNWLVERYAAIADHAHQRGLQVVLCGGPTEREKLLASAISNECGFSPVDLVGKTSLKQLTAVLQRASVVLCPDSGPAHLATTQGTPVIGLYAHSDPRRTGPYLSSATTISVYRELIESQTGKALEELPWGTRAKGQDLMANIELQPVITVLDDLIDKTII